MKIIDISGFGHSGKTAVTDYLKQYSCIYGFPNHVEFELFRVAGGLVDLYYSVFESWNLIRSTVRINEFKALVSRIGIIQESSNPISYFTASGHGYDQYFNSNFIKISEKYIDKIITAKQDTFWPYENLRVSPIRVFMNKFNSKYFNSLLTSEIYFSDRNQFISHTVDYIQELFLEVTNSHSHIILNNGFDPFNPKPCLDMTGDAFAISVDRDPRDIYASQINSKDNFIPDFEKTINVDNIKKAMTGFDNIDHFIFRYKTLKQNVRVCDDPRIIKIRYEEFLLDHENQTRKLKSSLGISDTVVMVNKKFSVQDSIKNVGIWKKYAELEEIKKIEAELGQYCFNY